MIKSGLLLLSQLTAMKISAHVFTLAENIVLLNELEKAIYDAKNPPMLTLMKHT
jgi:hypothetical protein